jgi:hypothetical protein
MVVKKQEERGRKTKRRSEKSPTAAGQGKLLISRSVILITILIEIIY